MPDGIKRVFATPLDAMDDAAKEELGTIRREGAKTYKYVQFSGVGAGGVVALVAGDIVYYDIYASHVVHGDVGNAETTKAIAAGQCQAAWDGVQAAGSDKFGWVLIKGESATIPTAFAGPPTAGDLLWAGVTDKTLTLAAAIDDPVVGYCLHVVNKLAILDCPF